MSIGDTPSISAIYSVGVWLFTVSEELLMEGLLLMESLTF